MKRGFRFGCGNEEEVVSSKCKLNMEHVKKIGEIIGAPWVLDEEENETVQMCEEKAMDGMEAHHTQQSWDELFDMEAVSRIFEEDIDIVNEVQRHIKNGSDMALLSKDIAKEMDDAYSVIDEAPQSNIHAEVKSTCYRDDSDSEIFRGQRIKFTGKGLKLKECEHMIVCNLEFEGGRGPDVDAIQIKCNSNHIWIDHCSLQDYDDGLIDIIEKAQILPFPCHDLYFSVVGCGAEGFQKLFFGKEEIAIPVLSTIEAACATHPTADVFINFASFRRKSLFATSISTFVERPSYNHWLVDSSFLKIGVLGREINTDLKTLRVLKHVSLLKKA
ncbi:probable pectate lyase 4 [Tanacetum coccineum]